MLEKILKWFDKTFTHDTYKEPETPKVNLKELNKKELLEYAKLSGVEVKRYYNKSTIIEMIEKFPNS